jgi:lipoyl-dependent peroxiredoxin
MSSPATHRATFSGYGQTYRRVSLLPAEERGLKLAVELDVTLPQVQDPEQAARIVTAAHQVCPYSNATRGNIDVRLTVNGRDIG